MNREEILAKSQQENRNKLDERNQSIETKSNSIAQSVGMLLCIVLGAIAYAVTHDIQFMNLAMSLFMWMFATERISCAIMSKSRGQWVFAGIVTVAAIAEVTVFLLKLFGVM